MKCQLSLVSWTNKKQFYNVIYSVIIGALQLRVWNLTEQSPGGISPGDGSNILAQVRAYQCRLQIIMYIG